MNRFLKSLLLILILTIFSTGQTFAAIENWKKSPWTEEKTYVEKSINKLGFGLLNVSIGWTALLFEPTRHSNIFTGVLKGMWRTVTNEAGGALHAVTFFIPVDIPLPDGGVNFEEGNEQPA